jgi:hypothetical protein
VKRVMLGAAAAAVATTAAVLVPQAAGATGGSTPTTEILINERVDYDTFGSQLDVGGTAKCTSALGEGTITASVSQAPPETPSPVTLSTGISTVVCDGNWHTFALTAIGAGFDAGRAKATVTVMPVAGSPTTTVTRWVTIVNV